MVARLGPANKEKGSFFELLVEDLQIGRAHV